MHTRASDAPFRDEFPVIVMQGQTDEEALHTMPHWTPDEPLPRELSEKHLRFSDMLSAHLQGADFVPSNQSRQMQADDPPTQEGWLKSQNAGTSEQVQTLPTDHATRKNLPVCTGVLDYFPLAIAAVANCSRVGNDQHNPGEPLHWSREKSADHADCIVRHLMERGKVDSDGVPHSAKAAWRALALLELELEAGR
jgi:hypothetical protein